MSLRPYIACALGEAPKYLVCDRVRAYGPDYTGHIRAKGIGYHLRIRSPSQSGYAERLIGYLAGMSLGRAACDGRELREPLRRVIL